VTRIPEQFNAAAWFVDRHLAEGRGGRTAFRHAGRSVTYAEVGEAVDRCAGALASLGVDLEQRVLLALDDSPAFATAFWIGAGAAVMGTFVAIFVTPLRERGGRIVTVGGAK